MSKDILERRLRDQIDEWNAEIDALSAQAPGDERDRRLAELREEVDAAMHKLEELRRQGSPAWQTSAENWGEGM